jgi:hypothetical protein
VTVVVSPEYPDVDIDQVKLYAGLLEFPREEVVAETLSSSFDQTAGERELSIQIDTPDLVTDRNYHYLVGLLPADTTENDIDYTELTLIMETDPFELQSNGSNGDIQRSSYDGELDDDSGDEYSRKEIEGAYDLSVSGRTDGRDWEVTFFAWKSAHVEGERRSRGRSRPEYVAYELEDGTAPELASLLDEKAEELGFSGRQKVEFVIDFVQSLPYVPDDVSKGFDDYTKFIIETLPEMGGDCEDTAIMLAAVLEAEPFGYDMILIQPPGHMAAGIYDTNPPDYYWELDGRKYSYIETTGTGWSIGDLPEDYVGESAYTYQV